MSTAVNYATRMQPRNLHTVLPSGSTTLECAIVYAYDGQPMPVIIDNLNNLEAVDVRLLNAIAYERNVDAWSSGWSEQIKREYLKQARTIQSRKGTIWAIKEVLKLFGQGASTIVERVGGRRFGDGTTAADGSRFADASQWATFAISLAQPITYAHGRLLIEAINAVKPARCHMVNLNFNDNPLRFGTGKCFGDGYTFGLINA